MDDDEVVYLAQALGESRQEGFRPASPLLSAEEELQLAAQVENSYAHASIERRRQIEAEAASDSALSQALRESAELATEKWKRQEDERLLAIQLEDSYRQAARQHQEQKDASFAGDIQISEALLDSHEHERVRSSLTETASTSLLHRACEHLQGSWDCPACTFRNDPYHSPCRACGQASPSHVLTFASIPPRLRYGVELELIVPNWVRDGYNCKWIAKELTKLGIPTEFRGYTHEIMTCWKIVTDASLSSSPNDLCCELVSPILVGDAGLENVRYLLESVRRLGIAINSTCGFHVHVDAETGQEQGVPAMGSLIGLQRIAQCFVALESAFDCLVTRDASRQATSRRTNQHRYCKSNRLAFGVLSNKKRWNQIAAANSVGELVRLVNPSADRYRKLNLTNLSKRERSSTCEFRQHGGVKELLTAEAWIRLILRFCDHASNRTSSSTQCFLSQEANVADELKALFELVACPGLEAYFTLERRLFSVVSPVSSDFSGKCRGTAKAWTCDSCKRRFGDSRSLSQHGTATGHTIHY
jgi:hypothetical protein